jgi:Fe-S cluster biosynthesis and repair protein YggX
MTRQVFCQKLQKEAPALTTQPYPGALGKRIFDNVSAEAWEQWKAHQTMLINEKRLSMIDAGHRKFLSEEMEKFLFGGDLTKIEGYVPPSN